MMKAILAYGSAPRAALPRLVTKAAVLLALASTVLTALPLAGQGLPRATPEEVGMASDRLVRLTTLMREYVDDGRMAGAVTIVARRGQVVYHEAVGARDIEANAPMRADDIFRIASQTKALISVGIMMLQEEGRLQIGDPVSRYLPEFAHTTVAEPQEGGGYEVVPASRSITLRHLLTHTAGIGYGGGPARDQWEAAGIGGWYFADRQEPIRETIARIAELPFDAHPGERWVYGYGTDILGAVIEEVSGQPLDQFLRTRILDPLQMRDTHFYLPPEKSDRLAVVYSAQEGAISRAPNPGGMVGQGAYLEGPRVSFSGGAGLLSTASDYARFIQMLLNGGELDGVRLLSRKSVDLMTTDHVGNIQFRPGQGFGLGFFVVEDLGERGLPGSVGEFGWGGAYHSTYWVDPEEELIAVFLTQLNPSGGIDVQPKVRSIIYGAIVD